MKYTVYTAIRCPGRPGVMGSIPNMCKWVLKFLYDAIYGIYHGIYQHGISQLYMVYHTSIQPGIYHGISHLMVYNMCDITYEVYHMVNTSIYIGLVYHMLYIMIYLTDGI